MMQIDSKLKNSRKTEYKTAKIQKRKRKVATIIQMTNTFAAEKNLKRK